MSEAAEKKAALEANRAFYAALAAGDAERMQRLWSTREPVSCVHPGRPALLGLETVLHSWRAMLDEPPPIRESGARVSMVRGVAFVTCREHIGSATLTATNVFVWEDASWRLVLHHAGLEQPAAAEPAPPRGHLH